MNNKTKLGFIGLGKMGLNMVKRLNQHGLTTLCHDIDSGVSEEIEKLTHASWASTIEELLEKLPSPRAIWIMVPAGKIAESLIKRLADALSPGDIIIDGGNSDYRNTRQLTEEICQTGVEFVDAGTSGGIHGFSRGYCLMVGGSQKAIETLTPYLTALAPENGWQHVGSTGNGHLVKMVHNAIEYGMMQAMAEGFSLLNKVDPQINLGKVAELWNQGSVIESWLMELSTDILNKKNLAELVPLVQDSGEGRWAVESAISNGIPVPVFAASVFARFSSQGKNEFADRYLAALRKSFGGHSTLKKE